MSRVGPILWLIALFALGAFLLANGLRVHGQIRNVAKLTPATTQATPAKVVSIEVVVRLHLSDGGTRELPGTVHWLPGN